MLAHELRNPLASLRNGARLLRLPEIDEASRHRAEEMMERQIENMVRMIDDLLDVSRITRGAIELEPRPLDLLAVLRGSVESVRHDFSARQQELHEVLPRSRCW